MGASCRSVSDRIHAILSFATCQFRRLVAGSGRFRFCDAIFSSDVNKAKDVSTNRHLDNLASFLLSFVCTGN